MRKGLTKTILVGGNSLALLAGAAWLGLRVKPAPFPPHPERTPELDTSELPSELPEPVRKYFRATLSEKVPVIESAVVWGRADFKVGRLWTRMRFKGYYIPGREFRRDMGSLGSACQSCEAAMPTWAERAALRSPGC